MYDYSTYSGASTGMSAGTLFFYLVVLCVAIAAQWKIFTKAGVPGWVCLIPFYNTYKLIEIAGMNGWMFLLMFVPFVNFIFIIKVMLDLAKVFGKGTGFGVGLIFLSPIFMCILGFGSAEYIGKE